MKTLSRCTVKVKLDVSEIGKDCLEILLIFRMNRMLKLILT